MAKRMVGVAVVGLVALIGFGLASERASERRGPKVSNPSTAASPRPVAEAVRSAAAPAQAAEPVLTLSDLAPGLPKELAQPSTPAVSIGSEDPGATLSREEARSRLLSPIEQRPASEQRVAIEQALGAARVAVETTRTALAELEARRAAGEDVTQLSTLVQSALLQRERAVHDLEEWMASFGQMAAAVPAEP